MSLPFSNKRTVRLVKSPKRAKAQLNQPVRSIAGPEASELFLSGLTAGLLGSLHRHCCVRRHR